jgi:hypothetical protein
MAEGTLVVAAHSLDVPDKPGLGLPEPTEAGAPTSPTRLLSAGKGPRRPLRYQWNVKQAENAALEVTTSQSVEVGGHAMPRASAPAMRVVVLLQPTSMSPQDDLKYAWSVESATADKAEPRTAELIEAQVGAMRGLSGSGTLSARGVSGRVGVHATPDAGPRAVDAQIAKWLSATTVVFPEEAVGLGARWEKTERAEGPGPLRPETCTLTELGSDSGTVVCELSPTTGPDQLPKDLAAMADIQSVIASGTARSTFRLSRIVPQTTFDATMRIAGGQEGQSVILVTQVKTVTYGTLH